MHEIIYKLKSHFEREVQSLRNEIESATQLLSELRRYCREQCEHEWVKDYIDINPDKSQHIIYCSKCELMKE